MVRYLETWKCKNRAGFTLIELLVVIAIIGLLSSIVLASLNSAREKARVAQTQANIHSIGQAIEMYYNDNNTCPYPTHCYDGSCDPWSGGLQTALTPQYLPSFPLQDPWGLKWRYHCHPGGGSSGECTCFFSSGPNKTLEAWPWGTCTFSGDDIGWCQGQPASLGY